MLILSIYLFTKYTCNNNLFNSVYVFESFRLYARRRDPARPEAHAYTRTHKHANMYVYSVYIYIYI